MISFILSTAGPILTYFFVRDWTSSLVLMKTFNFTAGLMPFFWRMLRVALILRRYARRF